MLEKSAQDPRIRTAAASALLAGGAIATAKVVHDHAEERRRERNAAFSFDAEETPRDGIARIARGQLDLTIDRLREVHGPDDGGEAVHEARKALKRLRALLRLSDGAFENRSFVRESAVLRDVGRALSARRDAQVLLDTLDALSARYSGVLRTESWSGLRGSLAAAAAPPMLVDSNDASSLLDVLSGARARVESWPVPEDGSPKSLGDGFAVIYRRGRKAFRAARTDPGSEALHDLRKRAKDLWHAAQLLAPVCSEQMTELGRDAHRLSDLLGEDHDLTILRDHGSQQAKLLTAAELELLVALTGHRQQALRLEAIQCAAALYREKPKKLIRRVALV